MFSFGVKLSCCLFSALLPVYTASPAPTVKLALPLTETPEPPVPPVAVTVPPVMLAALVT